MAFFNPGQPVLQHHTDSILGDLAVRESRLKEADGYYKQALEIFEQIGARLGQANTLQALARLQIIENEFGDARKNLERAINIREKIQDNLGLRGDFGITGQLFLAENKPKMSMLAFQKSLDALSFEQDPHGYRISLLGQAQAFMQIGLVVGLAACLKLVDKMPGSPGGQFEQLIRQIVENGDDELAEALERDCTNDPDGLRKAAVAKILNDLKEESDKDE